MIRFFAALALLAGLSLAELTDYHPIEGAYSIGHAGDEAGDGILRHCNLSPENKPHIFPPGGVNLPCHTALGPEIDIGHNNNYRGAALPEPLLLSLADLNKAEFMGASAGNPGWGFLNSWLHWFPRTNSSVSKQTTYFHKTRCGNGEEGEHIKTDMNIYKKCSPAHGPGVLNNTFHLPPNICLETCDGQPSCIGYTIDEAGSTCSILQGNSTGSSYLDVHIGYQLIGPNDEHTKPTNTKDTHVKNVSAASDYFAIDGAYYGTGNNDYCLIVDNGTKGAERGCPDHVGQPYSDQLAKLIYPRPLLPEDILLELADLNNAEQIVLRPDSDDDLKVNKLQYYPRTDSSAPRQTTYVHKTRCGDSADGTGRIVATNKNAYKKRMNSKIVMGLKSTFHLPPNVCKSTCDAQEDCVGYTIDTTEENCWILQMAAEDGVVLPEAVTSYWLIGPVTTM
jgi:hypothetical protein